MKNRPVVRPATAEDIDKYFPGRLKPTIKGWVGELNGSIIGIGGFAFVGGRWLAFCDLTEDARQYKLQLARTAKMIMGEAEKQGIRYIYADADIAEPMAIRWLESLGFSKDQRSMSLYRWQKGAD